ncbi:hypothetical protein ACIQWL_55790 [Streptomyces mirabilis]|uniref:hypothetical protein n=1 Tax=Streptomyces mirabilis TaxID=68239 RepID=UPI003823866D
MINAFQELGVDGEGIERFGMVALDVPPAADVAKVQRLLNHVYPRSGGTWKRSASPRIDRPLPPADAVQVGHGWAVPGPSEADRRRLTTTNDDLCEGAD